MRTVIIIQWKIWDSNLFLIGCLTGMVDSHWALEAHRPSPLVMRSPMPSLTFVTASVFKRYVTCVTFMFKHHLGLINMKAVVAQCLGITCLNPVFILQPTGNRSWPLFGKPVEFHPRSRYQEQCEGKYWLYLSGHTDMHVMFVIVMMKAYTLMQDEK